MRATTDASGCDSASDAARLSDRLIVCLASRWDIDPTSKHQVMQRLSRDNDVVWVNYHASRRPALSRGDITAAVGRLAQVLRGPAPIHERMVQFTPLVLPGLATPFRDTVNRLLLVRQLRRVIRSRRRDPGQPVQLWTFAPDTAFLAGALGEECLVYYCVDEFAEFAGYDRDGMRRAERALMERADLVLTTSEPLLAARRDRHPNVHLVRHGVDHGHFARAVDGDLPLPAPLRGISRPIAGFIGLVQHWLDLGLLAETAQRMPDLSFVLVGECAVDTSALRRLPNVHCLGRKPYAQLPAYCAAFDVGLIPFVRSSLTEHVNPIKLREYLAAGLPVIATDLPEVRRYAPDVRCAEGAVAFAAAIREALGSSTLPLRRARSARVACESWDAVVSQVTRLVMQSAGRRPPQ